jgi:hypothetical protein
LTVATWNWLMNVVATGLELPLQLMTLSVPDVRYRTLSVSNGGVVHAGRPAGRLDRIVPGGLDHVADERHREPFIFLQLRQPGLHRRGSFEREHETDEAAHQEQRDRQRHEQFDERESALQRSGFHGCTNKV